MGIYSGSSVWQHHSHTFEVANQLFLTCQVPLFINASIQCVMYIHTRAGSVQNLDREVKKCLLESFKRTDEEFLKKAADASPTWKDGYIYDI